VNDKEEVRLLPKEWPLRKRAPRTNAPTADGQQAVSTPKAKMTIACQYLHRSVRDFLQHIGSKAVSAFSSHIHENFPNHKGKLRRPRGTRYKYEVCFSQQDAELKLKEDFFLVDSTCRAGLVRALAAVLMHTGRCVCSPRAGPPPVGREPSPAGLGLWLSWRPRCGPTSISAPQKGTRTTPTVEASVMRTAPTTPAPPPQLAAAERTGTYIYNFGRGGGGRDEGGNSGLGGSGGDGVVAVGSFDARDALNGGQRPEWVAKLSVVSRIFVAHGATAFNGLRITDGTDPRRAGATRPPPPPPPSQASPPSAAIGTIATMVAAPAAGTVPSTNLGSFKSGGGHPSVFPPIRSSHDSTGAGAWGNLTATHDASMS